MRALDLLVHGGPVVTEEGVFPANLGVRDGKIVAMLTQDERPSVEEAVDAIAEPGRTRGRGDGRLLRREVGREADSARFDETQVGVYRQLQ
jgi:urease alpha subunit